MDKQLFRLAEELGRVMRSGCRQLALAESCTGGAIAQTITDVPGSSAWFDRGFVSYSNAAKVEMLQVNPETLERCGAVSEQTALEMVEGALRNSRADLAIAVTGIAGPDGGTETKPVGTVFVAWQLEGQSARCVKKSFQGDRQTVRYQVVEFCLHQALSLLQGSQAC